MQKSASYYGQLLEGYLDSNVSVDEANELFDFIQRQPDEARELLQASGGADYREKIKHLENIDESVSRRMLERLLNVIATSADQAQPVAHRVHFLKTSWFRYAAAVILMLGAGTYVRFANQREEVATTNGNKRLQADIAPGSSKAVLTLADGSTMVLDDAQNGDLVQQGNTKVVKLATGQLAYKMGSVSVSKEVLYNTISTPRGGQYQIVLPDGSKVWLNAASSIKFPTAFTGSSRSVEMVGEAYMEIAKNSRQPFTVKSNGTEVLVLGTSFNVNAYANEDAIKTTLIDGSVKVKTAKEETLLKPGEQAVIKNQNDQISKNEVVIQDVIAWKNGFFSFNQADLATVLRQLERWYDIEVKYSGKIPVRHFNGELPRSLKLSQVISVLNELEVKFRIEGRTLIVSS